MKKKLLSVLMAAVMVAGVGGVGAAQVKADDEKILGAGIYSASDNFNSYIGKAITNACDGIFKTNIEDGQNDQSTQNNQVDTMLAKGASAVAVSVCDVTAAPTLIQKCKDAGNVPIIFFNKEITDYDVINSYENAYQVTQIAIGSIGIGDFQIPYLIIIAAAVCVVMWIVWNKTKFGKYMFAVGGNPEAAKVSGVNVIKTQIMVYAIAGMMYAFAAALEVGRIGSASNTTGNGYEMDAVAACVIGGVSLSGGVGSVGGIVIGVLMFTVINYGLAFIGVNMYWQYIVKGLIILLAVIIDMRKYAKRK